MSWVTPKTDWRGDTASDGTYIGDRFNAVDFNRIKNNLEYLHELAIILYKDFTINSLGSDRTPEDYFYADEINTIEDNFKIINNNTLRRSYGTPPTYVDNGNTMDFTELNRLESAMLDLYDRLTNEYEGGRKFTWNFEMKGGDL
jgi:hypothetical protein